MSDSIPLTLALPSGFERLSSPAIGFVESERRTRLALFVDVIPAGPPEPVTYIDGVPVTPGRGPHSATITATCHARILDQTVEVESGTGTSYAGPIEFVRLKFRLADSRVVTISASGPYPSDARTMKQILWSVHAK